MIFYVWNWNKSRNALEWKTRLKITPWRWEGIGIVTAFLHTSGKQELELHSLRAGHKCWRLESGIRFPGDILQIWYINVINTLTESFLQHSLTADWTHQAGSSWSRVRTWTSVGRSWHGSGSSATQSTRQSHRQHLCTSPVHNGNNIHALSSPKRSSITKCFIHSLNSLPSLQGCLKVTGVFIVHNNSMSLTKRH